MIALAGYPLGFEFLFVDRSERHPGRAGSRRSWPAILTIARCCVELAERSDVISFRLGECLGRGAAPGDARSRARIAPPLRALAAAQDRLAEKRTFERLPIATTRFAAVDSTAALERAMRRIGLPGVLKTRRFGYDGKGQYVLRSAADVAAAWPPSAARRCSTRNSCRSTTRYRSSARAPRRRDRHLPAQSQLSRRRHPAPDAGTLDRAGIGQRQPSEPAACAARRSTMSAC